MHIIRKRKWTAPQRAARQKETEAETMEHTKDIYNPETWTEQDREFLDAVRQLTPAEMKFTIDLIEILNADPGTARAYFAEKQARNYKLRTEEGRAAFMAALKAC